MLVRGQLPLASGELRIRSPRLQAVAARTISTCQMAWALLFLICLLLCPANVAASAKAPRRILLATLTAPRPAGRETLTRVLEHTLASLRRCDQAQEPTSEGGLPGFVLRQPGEVAALSLSLAYFNARPGGHAEFDHLRGALTGYH